jgi:glycerate-2-kinase
VKIRNYDTLVSHGNIKGRKDILEIINAGLEAIDPAKHTKALIRIQNDQLIAEGTAYECKGDPQSGASTYNLKEVENIWVVGCGKGAQYVAKALEEILGDRLSGGEIILKHGDPQDLKKIHVTYGGHPVPDEGCVEGCKRIFELSKQVTERDIVITIAANGISSLLTMPVSGVSLDDVKKVTSILQIEKGVNTGELNRVRNHLDIMKGGRITRYFKKAQLIHLLVIDVNLKVGGSEQDYHGYEEVMRKNIWLHTLSEGSTFADAVRVLKRYEAWDSMPENIKRYLEKASPEDETVKYEEYRTFRFRMFGIMPEELGVLPAAKKKALELGYTPMVLTQILQTEASSAGLYAASIARGCEHWNEPIPAPCCFFTTGEMLVTCGKNPGVGGRNQEFILSAAARLAGSACCVMASVDTDGTDGPGGFIAEDAPQCLSGAIADGQTIKEINNKKLDITEALNIHGTSKVLWETNNAILIDQNISIGDFSIILITA